MAATPFDIPAPGSSYAFDIYNDGPALQPTTPAPALPGGPCNYTDQSLPRCGCRRFWSRASLNHSSVFQDNVVNNQAEICMCSHHACFHEDVQPGQTQPAAAAVNAAAAGQENQRPRTNREPLSPVQGFASLHMPASLGVSMDFNLLDFHSSVPAPRMEAAIPAQVEDAHPGQDSPMPDTFTSWGDLTRSQAGHASGLPPFPPQCLMSPPPPPSTASSSQGRYLRPFAGKGLQTLSGASALRPDARRPERIEEDVGAEAAQNTAPAAADVADTPKASPSQARSASSSEGSYQRLADRVDSHEQRLDRLETNSFSVAGHDDCHDKHENVDLRVTELESRVDEVEKILNDNGSVASSRRTARQDGGADDATASVVSVSTNATVRAEVYTQLQHLQAQVSQLQAAALPSYTKPWELEVVFLPFPLKGIWIEGREFLAGQRRSVGSNADDWTQMPNTLSRATPDPQSPKFQEWTGQGLESNWLLPKAFAAGRVIDQRLKSRGLIKTVLVRGADARSVQLAINHAFGDVLRVSSNAEVRSGFAPEYPLAEFLGLRQAWVPLRKLHKDSRLRFLSPSEMATPALWDFTFLVSSVVMKATGIQRLYITQPEAYLQDHPLGCHAVEAGWTWQKLRLLSRVYPDSQSSARDVPEADAMEECWNWNERLDEVPGANASAISLRQSIQQRISRRSSTEPSQQFYTGVQSPILDSTSRSRAQSPLIQRQRKDSWPPHIRTGSLPPVGPALLSPAQSRRRVSSHAASATPYERRPSPFVPRASPRPSPRLSASHHINVPSTSAAVAAGAKRRFTRSPSLVPRNTPRWSRTSMSRSPSLAPGGPYGFHDERDNNNNRERRTTPFFYATPHSEAVHEPYGYQRAGSRGPPPTAMLRTNGYEPDDDEDEEMSFTDTDRGSETDPYDSEMTNADDGQNGQGGGGAGSAQRRSGHGSNHLGNGSFGFQTDGDGDEADLDIDVYEDEDEDELDGVETDGGVDHHHHHRHQHHHSNSNSRHHPQNGVWHGFAGRQTTSPLDAAQQQQPLRPEDIPWAGIEDAADADGDSNMSDGENVDPTTTTASFSSSSSGRSSGSQGPHSQPSQARQIEHPSHQGDDDVPQQGQINADLGENGDGDDDGAQSSGSEAPSEYSSKPAAWPQAGLFGGVGSAAAPTAKGIAAGLQGQHQHQLQQQSSTLTGFRIHEDRTATAGAETEAAALALTVVAEGEGELLDTQWG